MCVPWPVDKLLIPYYVSELCACMHKAPKSWHCYGAGAASACMGAELLNASPCMKTNERVLKNNSICFCKHCHSTVIVQVLDAAALNNAVLVLDAQRKSDPPACLPGATFAPAQLAACQHHHNHHPPAPPPPHQDMAARSNTSTFDMRTMGAADKGKDADGCVTAWVLRPLPRRRPRRRWQQC